MGVAKEELEMSQVRGVLSGGQARAGKALLASLPALLISSGSYLPPPLICRECRRAALFPTGLRYAEGSWGTQDAGQNYMPGPPGPPAELLSTWPH